MKCYTYYRMSWKKIELLVNGRIPLSVYSSARTGLRFAIGDVPGPMIKSCVSLVTEASSDDGLPHTLEHLVFMGSEKYPFKGFLDIIANRCFAEGTNAWTDQDHTAYTLDTVGAEGFYKTFPVYLNHILRPTLTREQYHTEVHHVNEKGEDAGVVYCEMQDHESEMDSILDRKMRTLLYPAKHAYSVDTGGKLKEIRELCSLERVRNFHKTFYHIDNVFSIICGKVDHGKVCKIMEQLEEAEIERIPADFARPFTTPVPALTESVVTTIPCPTDDPSHGAVLVSWLGPPSRDCYTSEALDILFTYMTDTAVSPFHRNFIDIPEPLASSTYFHLSEQTTSCIALSFGGVPATKLDQVLPVMERVLREHEEASKWDAERMGFVCRQAVLNAHAALETRPAKNIYSSLIVHQLYGEGSEDDLNSRMNDASLVEKLSREPMSFWADLVTRFLAAPKVTLLGQPSEQLVDSLMADETARVEEQRKKLGSAGLEKCKTEFCDAVKCNTSTTPPKEILDSLMVNELENFAQFPIEVHSKNSSSAPASVKRILDSFPCPLTVHHSPGSTKFAEMWLAMDSHALTEQQRLLLSVFFELPFESPAVIDGTERTAEEVCTLFTKDLLQQSLHTGIGGSFDRAVVLWLKVDAARFENVVRWSENFLKGTIITAEKIKTIATRLSGEARERKRDGNYICHVALNSITCKKDSNSYLVNELVLQKVHESLAKECGKDPAGVVARFEELRSALLHSGFNAHVLCDADLVEAPSADLWKFAQRDSPMENFHFPAGEDSVASYTGQEVIVPIGSCESSFLNQSTPFEATWTSPHLVPTLILANYLSQCEGPLWKSVRGSGLAYGCWISANVDDQELSLGIYRSSNVGEAYEKARSIVQCELAASLDPTQFEAAKRSLICETYSKVGSVSGAGGRSVLAFTQKKEPGFLRKFAQQVWEADAKDVLAVGAPHILGLFEKYARAVCTHSRQAAAAKKAFPSIKTVKIDALVLPPRP